MPIHAVCPEPGCAALTTGGPCPEHRLARSRARRLEPQQQIYRDPRWRHTRATVIARDGSRCTFVGEHGRCTETRALHAHHTPLSVLELLERGLDPFDPHTAVALCKRHHSTVDARVRVSRR